MTETTLTRLTAQNVAALDQARTELGLPVTTTKTTATFPMSPEWTARAIQDTIYAFSRRYSRAGHPVRSLHAVRRKAEAATPTI